MATATNNDIEAITKPKVVDFFRPYLLKYKKWDIIYTQTHTHTHTHIYIYIYIYITSRTLLTCLCAVIET